ncbi:hypothetical protein BJF78_09235 [Pseudonocardia sp. CNS-139]|nr:hypothetical protein BJF78_09235 [Pseudonocardia sp. CNS-139]
MNADDHLAGFCRTLPRLRDVARSQGLTAELATVLREVRDGAPIAPLLPRLGIPADVLRAGYQAVPLLTGRPAGEVYTCPWDACSRVVPREPGGPVPDERCWVLDEPLRPGRA